MRGIPGATVGAALIGGAAQVALPVPLSPVPVTLQSLAVLLVGVALGARWGAASVVLYLAAGAAGLPLFAEGGAGSAHLAGKTAGYLWAFVPAAALSGRVRTRAGGVLAAFAWMLVAHALILALGFGWLATSIGAGPAWTHGVEPFLVGAVVKSAAGAALWIAGRRALGLLLARA